MNERFYNWVGDPQMLAEIQAVAPAIAGYAALTQIFLDLAEQALARGHILKGAYYLRTAEFFLSSTDARKQSIRQRFVHLVLEEAHLPMTLEWEKPVRAVLDCFHLDDVTLMGFSLGGGLAIRAAAFEPRVRRVIAYDILTDVLEVILRSFPTTVREQVTAWLASGNADALNAFVAQTMTQRLLVEWGAGCPAAGGSRGSLRPRVSILRANRDVETRALADRPPVRPRGAGPEPLPGRQFRLGAAHHHRLDRRLGGERSGPRC
jgi:hypothetical protein